MLTKRGERWIIFGHAGCDIKWTVRYSGSELRGELWAGQVCWAALGIQEASTLEVMKEKGQMSKPRQEN